MPRKLIYLVFFLVILGAIIGPAIYSQKINSSGQVTGSSPRIKSEDSFQKNQNTGNALVSPGDTAKDSEQKTTAGTFPQTGETPAKSDLTARTPPAEKKGASGVENQSSGATAQTTTDAPSPDKQARGCVVGVAVVGMNGELLFGPKDVTINEKNRWEITALGALDATGLPYTMSASWGNFVESIAGQRNKGQAGWMYKVNEEVPLVAADQKAVKTGDKIIWWYSKSMQTPPPKWDELGPRAAS